MEGVGWRGEGAAIESSGGGVGAAIHIRLDCLGRDGGIWCRHATSVRQGIQFLLGISPALCATQ